MTKNRRSQTAFISVRGVTKVFNHECALRNVSIEINQGSRIGVLGDMGSGKSTLINSIARVRGFTPTSGCIIFHISICQHCNWVDFPSARNCERCGGEMIRRDVDIWNEDDSKLIRRVRASIGIVLQRSFGVYGNLSALENVVEILQDSEPDLNQRYHKAAKVLESVNMLHRSSHQARDLSGGEKQRLILARQLAKNPMVLLADDPTGSLDQENADLICRVLNAAFRDRVLIVTSHIFGVLRSLSDTAILLDEGKVEQVGDAASIIDAFAKRAVPSKSSRRLGKHESIVRLENVTKVYHKMTSGIVKALAGVDLSVDQGTILGVVGESGAGKTTLSKIVAGAIQPTSGSVCIRIGDEWISMREPGESGKGRATRYIGVLYQDYSLYSAMTVFENLAKSTRTELPDEFMKVKVVHILKRIGFQESQIEQLLKRLPDELSEGERHRVALARVMMRDPRIVILDEPSGTLNPISKAEFSWALRSLAAEYGTTIILVSHDEEFAVQTCDQIALMASGKILGLRNLLPSS